MTNKRTSVEGEATAASDTVTLVLPGDIQTNVTLPTDFVESNRMRNRNFRMPWATEEAYLQAAHDLSPDDNVSDIFRRISDGRLANLVETGYLCPICRGVNCTRHVSEARAWRLERDWKLYQELHRRFGKRNGTADE